MRKVSKKDIDAMRQKGTLVKRKRPEVAPEPPVPAPAPAPLPTPAVEDRPVEGVADMAQAVRDTAASTQQGLQDVAAALREAMAPQSQEPQQRQPVRLVVNRDSRGLIETIDVIPRRVVRN